MNESKERDKEREKNNEMTDLFETRRKKEEEVKAFDILIS